ncbi:MAG: ankyrin repeat domain-containing protein [Spirochaetales bacterium]|nr:ankyrin repeat domain-containing protein [Spirochaetales bacterium]
MNRNSRQFLLLLGLQILFIFPLYSAERWPGPVALEEFRFDRMELHAIGWSEKGLFAYGTVSPSESGGFHWQWYVLDLIDDKVLYESPRWTLLEGQTPRELWNLHPEWYTQLVRFKIEPGENFESGGQLFDHDGAVYRISYSMDRSETESHPGGRTQHISVELFRNSVTGKTVYSYSPTEEGGVVEDLILKGYILSPYEKRTAIVVLEKSGDSEESVQWRYRIIGAHLSVGFSPVNQSGSALAEAVLNGQFYVTRMLLSEGADPDSPDPRDYSPLLISARLGHWEITSLLLESGASSGGRDERGRTALHYAAEAGEEQIIRLLLKAGADKSTQDLQGKRAFDLAAGGRAVIRRLLR